MSLNEVLGLFCYLIVLVPFAFSAGQKWRDHTTFERSVEGFALVPKAWVSPVAWLVTGTESIVVALLLGGTLWSGLRFFGMLLALALLVLFTAALISVVARGLNIACGCFGTDERPISTISLVRNVGLLIGSALGALLAIGTPSPLQYPIQDFLLIALPAATFVLLWINLDRIALLVSFKTV